MAAALGVMPRHLVVVSGPAGGYGTTRPTMGGDAQALRGGIVRFPLKPRRGSLCLRCQAGETPSAVREPVDKANQKDNVNGSLKDDREDAFATTAKGAPVTFERPVPTNLEFEKPYLSRALKAVDGEHPYGTEDYPDGKTVRRDLTVLQQHVDFFDTNKDGWIYPWETYSGFRRIGFSPLISGTAAVLINGAFSYPSLPGWIPNPLFGIYTEHIHKTKHGSDTEVYDTEGRFVPSKFEEIFSKYAKTYPDRISLDELNNMTNANRNVLDLFGSTASKLEWGITYQLVKDEEGYCTKDAIRGVFDGSFFVYMENKLKAEKAKKQ